MNLIIYFLMILLVCVMESRSSMVDYSEYSLFVVTPKSEIQLKILQNIIANNTYAIEFWSHPYKIDANVKVLVPNEAILTFKTFLESNKIYFFIEKVNLNGFSTSNLSSNRKAENYKLDLNEYNTYDNVIQWLKNKANSCKICKLTQIGTTIQNRSIYLITIGYQNKSGIFIDANIHAREWITGVSALQLINIVSNSTDPQGKYFTSKFTFHIVPFANPDGYEYSRLSARLWRKNRKINVGSSCIGVDPNRNYQTAFGGAGSSNYACDEIYRGPKAFSEPESKALSSYITTNKNKLIAYIALHSYGRLILLPWGCNYSKPADYNELLRVGNAMNTQIRNFTGINYDVIPGSALYPAGGASDDWAKARGIKYVYTIEMGPDRFDPPSFQIPALVKEFIGAIKGMVDSLPKK